MDPLLRAWECFREEIRDILGSCARTTNSKSKITCSQWKSASSATWNTHLFQPGPNLLNCWMIKCLYFEMLLSFWDCKLLAGSACRGGLAFCGSGEDFFQTVSPCLFAIVSIISLGSWIAYFASYTDFWHVLYLYVADDLHNLSISMTTYSCHGERNFPPWHTTDREKSREVSPDRYFILESGLSFAFSLYNMSTLDERRVHKQEAGVKVHCYSLQMADKELLEWLGEVFCNGSDLHVLQRLPKPDVFVDPKPYATSKLNSGPGCSQSARTVERKSALLKSMESRDFFNL